MSSAIGAEVIGAEVIDYGAQAPED